MFSNMNVDDRSSKVISTLSVGLSDFLQASLIDQYKQSDAAQTTNGPFA